eukprot:TRINITY_DN28038_c0_g1_i1.p1 TRINITY_DN28038_c0_g1~~TRINITY_DN28038_c0_g1_i1.p1  ORF type:complete len:100 (+),score=16.06 TRINITY_DN28038_c0_g1_i1:337-636(+)
MQCRDKPASFIGQDLAILSGEVSMNYDEQIGVTLFTRTKKVSAIDEEDEDMVTMNDEEEQHEEQDDLLVDMDEIRTLISSDLPSDLNYWKRIETGWNPR